jgi:Uma2 family endonuclease
MSDSLPLMTADALLSVPDDGMRRELIEGEVRVMEPSGFGHGVVAGRIGRRLAGHVEEHRLGVTLTADPGFVLATAPDTVRAPDVAFVRQERYEAIGHTVKYWPEAPDLAVEVVSPNDPFSEVEEKAFQWLAAGTRLVLVADPRRRTITAYRAPDDVRLHVEGEVIDADNAVPGWTLDVSDTFS